jgi:hypothetical protein
LSNSTAHINLTRIDKYSADRPSDISREIFDRASNEVDRLSLKAVDEQQLEVGLDTNYDTVIMDVSIEPDITASNHIPGPAGDLDTESKVKIQTKPGMTFGYQNHGALDDFLRASQALSSATGSVCFDGETPSNSFILGELKTQAPPKEQEIDDEELGLHATFENSTMVFNLENPSNLTKSIKKYFHPSI